MACRHSSPTAKSDDPSKQDLGGVLDQSREKIFSSPTGSSAHSSEPALGSATNSVEETGGEGRELSPPSLTTGVASTNLPGSAAPDRSNNSSGPEIEAGDRFECFDRDNSSAVSAGAASHPSSASATTTAAAAPVEGKRVPAFNFSFAMGGWLMFYSFGVAKCLLDHGLHKVRPTQQTFIGSSAGSLAAAALALEADIDKASAKSCFRLKTARRGLP